jgi:uncharacterized coiled-coil protein SlyX
MNDQNIDVNLIIQSFQERINQLMTEVVVKDATIRQLSAQIQEIESQKSIEKKDK